MIKKFLKKNKLTSRLYVMLRDRKYARENKKKNKLVQKDGMRTIEELQSIMEKSGVFFFFDMGTLLGIVREGRLLSHDIDIDMAAFVDDEVEKETLTRYLESKGCTLYRRYMVDSLGTVEASYLLNDIKFDINFYYREGKSDVCYLLYCDPAREYTGSSMDVVKLSCGAISGTEKRELSGIYVSCPVNAPAYLAERYGEGWRVPDKGYVYWRGPSAEKTELVGHYDC